ncbi:transglycosylase SLT domain-containing protein [Peribacillus phoenicis]|uniref:transglycosylase SLT domain-containing protein n=1 Tax=unclassified Peribacillus TaxID=2675266 RepID=UPI0039A078D0
MSNQKMYEIAFRLGASVSPSLKAAIASTNKRLSSLNNNSRLLEKSMIGVSKSVTKTAASTVKMAVAMSAVKVALAGVTAASAPVIAGVGALGASLASAGIGAAAFGAVAASAIGKVVEASGEVEKIEEKIAKADSAKERIAAQKELAAVYAGMSSEQRGALKNLQGFKSFWGGFVKGFEKPIFKAFGTSLQIAKNGLKLLGPTIQNVAGVVVELTEKFNTALKGSSMKGFFEWLTTNAAESLYNFAHVAGNTLSGTMSLFQAFAPLGASMEEGLVGMTARFKEWAAGLSNSKGFQNFIEYAKANGPVLLGVVGNILTVIKNLIVGLAPLGSTVLKVVESITGFIAKLTSTGTNMDAFKAKALEIFGKVQQFVLPLVSKVGSFVLNTFRKISAFWSENGSSIISALSKVFGVAGAIFKGLVSVVQTILPIIMPIVSKIVSFAGGIIKQLVVFWNENGSQIIQAVQNLFSGINKIIQFLAPVLLFILNSVWSNVKGIIQGALNIIMGAIKIFSGLFTGDFSKMWEGVKQLFFGAIQVVWNYVNLLFIGKILGGIKALASGAITKVSGMWTSIKEFFTGGATAVWQKVVNLGPKLQSGFSSIKDKAINFAKEMWSGIKEQFGKIVEGAKALPGKMGSGIKSMAGKALDGTVSMGNRMLRGIGKIVNGVIDGLNFIMGKKGLSLGITIGKWDVPQYAKGTSGHPGGLAILGDGKGANAGPELYRTPSGFTGLSPGTDTLMNLPRGTHVIPAKETRQALSNIPAYDSGTVTNRIQTAGKWVGNGTKTIANKTKSGAKKVKETAFDIYEYISDPGKLMNKLLEKYNVTVPSFSGTFGDMATGSFKMIKESAKKFLKSKLADFGGGGNWSGGTAAPSQVKSWVTQALNMTGTPLSWLPAMLVKAQKESGYNPRAINLWDINAKRGIPSKGLFQTIDPTFNAYKMAGMNDIYNPIHNAVAAIRYIKSRYGTVFNTPGIKSMARGGAYKGYYKGGQVDSSQWAWVGEDGPELMKMRGGSRVFNNKKSNSILSRLLSFGNSEGQTNQQNNKNSESNDQFVFAPVIHIAERTDKMEIENYVKTILGDQYEEFKKMMKKFKKDEDRMSFNT